MSGERGFKTGRCACLLAKRGRDSTVRHESELASIPFELDYILRSVHSHLLTLLVQLLLTSLFTLGRHPGFSLDLASPRRNLILNIRSGVWHDHFFPVLGEAYLSILLSIGLGLEGALDHFNFLTLFTDRLS